MANQRVDEGVVILVNAKSIGAMFAPGNTNFRKGAIVSAYPDDLTRAEYLQLVDKMVVLKHGYPPQNEPKNAAPG